MPPRKHQPLLRHTCYQGACPQSPHPFLQQSRLQGSPVPMLSLCSQTLLSRPLTRPLHPPPPLHLFPPIHTSLMSIPSVVQRSRCPAGKAFTSPWVTGWFRLTLWSRFMGHLLREGTSQPPSPSNQRALPSKVTLQAPAESHHHLIVTFFSFISHLLRRREHKLNE